MNPLLRTFLPVAATLLAFASLARPLNGADAEQVTISAKELASRLAAVLQDGASYVRLRLNVKQPSETTKITLQIQIKQRRTKEITEVVYQVLWPGERKGEAVLLRSALGRPVTGSVFVPPDKLRSLASAQMSDSLFGSDLSYQDLIENFFAWDHQAIAGSEVVNHVSCLILESKPGRGEQSIYSSVRSWIDPRQLVPLRVEKYASSNQLVRRIDTTRVVTDDKGRSVPSNLIVRGPRENSVSELDGSRIKHDVPYTEHEFTPEGLKEVTIPRSPPE
jgi:hypothetical protein